MGKPHYPGRTAFPHELDHARKTVARMGVEPQFLSQMFLSGKNEGVKVLLLFCGG